MPMNEIAIKDRQWRWHSLAVAAPDPAQKARATVGTSEACTTPVVDDAGRPGWLATMKRVIRPCMPPRGFENTLRDLTADWAIAKTPEEVETSFLMRLAAFAPSARFELARAAECASHDDDAPERWSRRLGESVLEIPLRCAGISRDRLRVYHRLWGRCRIHQRKIARIRLFCDLAARARESLRPHTDGSWQESNVLWRDDMGLKADWKREPEPEPDAGSRSTLIHDATFLSAILPFAIAQAKRHRESLSVLCIAIDRLGGVKDLLGRAAVDRVVATVGEVSASMIRTSDIVCRLDDDRMLVVLPRAAGEDAVHIAQSIRHAIAARPIADIGEPSMGLTVSIGVAAYPTGADNVFSLFEAVDAALARAQELGRDQVALAPVK